MDEVVLSKTAICGVVKGYWGKVELPDHVYICLETCPGFGESEGGFGVGSVVNALTDLESGFFFSMARIDELILNIPDPAEVGSPPGEPGQGAGTPEALLAGYPWEFAESARGVAIRWEE